MDKLNKETYTVKEVSVLTGLDDSVIRYRIKTGEIRALRIEHTIRIFKTEVQRILVARD